MQTTSNDLEKLPLVDSSRLTIVIPALNEEAAIGDTISRCLATREDIKRSADLTDLEIIVVSDGSSDRTAEIAQAFDDVQVVVFAENRGYGAAIKEGWQRGSGDLLGFLDADGTCDPSYFAEMCRLATDESADVVLGSRMGPDSRMPLLRRVGNRVFAILLGFLCGRYVSDTASGMRVVRRSALKDLYPLPDGLHFTPAMSARALLNQLRVLEIPMQYEERIGQSKLNVMSDGVRFLRAIISGVLCYRPEKIFLMCFVACALAVLLLALNPTEFYVTHGRLEEWMIYRFVVCSLLGSFGLLLLLATALSYQMAFLSRRRSEAKSFWSSCVSAIFNSPTLVALVACLFMGAVFFLWPGIVEFVATRQITLHWSRLLAGSFSLFSLLQVLVFAVLMKVVAIWRREHDHEHPSHSGVRGMTPHNDSATRVSSLKSE